MNPLCGFGPVSASEFVSHYWDQKPLHAPKIVDDDLLKLDAKRLYREYALQGIQARGFTSYHEADENRQQAREAVLALWSAGSPPTSEQLAEFNGGRALIVRGGQTHLAELANFLQPWHTFFNCRLNANVYVTRPGSSVFCAHHDPHHVFALQVDGEKDWFLWAPAVDAPHSHYRFQEVEPVGEPIIMHARLGDLIYIPLGWIHRAKTMGDLSVHITVGINSPRWLDLIEQALDDAAGEFSVFRKGLPFRLIPDSGMEFVADGERHVDPILGLLMKDMAKRIPSILRQISPSAK